MLQQNTRSSSSSKDQSPDLLASTRDAPRVQGYNQVHPVDLSNVCVLYAFGEALVLQTVRRTSAHMIRVH